MNKECFNKYVEERYNQEVKWYDGMSKSNKKRYELCQSSMIILSAVTPILALTTNAWITAGVASILAVITNIQKVFKFQENWISYRTTCETLRHEKHFFDASCNEYEEVEDKEKLFIERVESLISRESTLWVNNMKKIEDEKKK